MYYDVCIIRMSNDSDRFEQLIRTDNFTQCFSLSLSLSHSFGLPLMIVSLEGKSCVFEEHADVNYDILR